MAACGEADDFLLISCFCSIGASQLYLPASYAIGQFNQPIHTEFCLVYDTNRLNRFFSEPKDSQLTFIYLKQPLIWCKKNFIGIITSQVWRFYRYLMRLRHALVTFPMQREVARLPSLSNSLTTQSVGGETSITTQNCCHRGLSAEMKGKRAFCQKCNTPHTCQTTKHLSTEKHLNKSFCNQISFPRCFGKQASGKSFK